MLYTWVQILLLRLLLDQSVLWLWIARLIRVSEFEIPSDSHPWFDRLLGSCNGLLCFADSDGVYIFV